MRLLSSGRRTLLLVICKRSRWHQRSTRKIVFPRIPIWLMQCVRQLCASKKPFRIVLHEFRIFPLIYVNISLHCLQCQTDARFPSIWMVSMCLFTASLCLPFDVDEAEQFINFREEKSKRQRWTHCISIWFCFLIPGERINIYRIWLGNYCQLKLK